MTTDRSESRYRRPAPVVVITAALVMATMTGCYSHVVKSTAGVGRGSPTRTIHEPNRKPGVLDKLDDAVFDDDSGNR